MALRGNIGTLAVLALLAEVIVFAAVAAQIGVGSALVLTMLSSLLGVAMLRRSGATTLGRLRRMATEPLTREHALVDGLIAGGGALLLIVPGFLSDIVGLFLLAPSCREWLLGRLGAGPTPPPRAAPRGTIDLEADDWRRIDPVRSP